MWDYSNTEVCEAKESWRVVEREETVKAMFKMKLAKWLELVGLHLNFLRMGLIVFTLISLDFTYMYCSW